LKRERGFLARGIGATAVVNGCSAGLALVTTAFLARRLGVSGYGTYAWALAWVYTLRIPSLAGTDRLVTREIAARDARESPDPADVVAWADRSVLRTAVPIALVVAAGALVWSGAAGTHLTGYLALAMPLLPVATLVLVRQAALLADRRVAWALLPDNVLRPTFLLVLVVAIAVTPGVELNPTTALLAHIAAGCGALVVASVGARRAFGALRWVARRAKPSGWYGAGARIGASNTLIALSLQMDLLLLGILRGPRDAGVYAVITRANTVVNLPTLCTAPAFSAVVARLYGVGDMEGLRRSLKRVTRLVSATTIAGCVAIGVAAEPLLHLVTPGFESGAGALQVLLCAAALSSLAGFNLALLTLTGHERPALRATTAATAVAVALGIVLIPPLGVSGAAIAAIVRVAVRNGLGCIAAWRELRVDSTVLGIEPAAAAASSARA
jgi:O-antigen/teichoic acid export membrane protein